MGGEIFCDGSFLCFSSIDGECFYFRNPYFSFFDMHKMRIFPFEFSHDPLAAFEANIHTLPLIRRSMRSLHIYWLGLVGYAWGRFLPPYSLKLARMWQWAGDLSGTDEKTLAL